MVSEDNIRKHKSSVTTVEVDLENQGVLAKGIINARAPNMIASEMMFTTLGKKIGWLTTYFDGNTGGLADVKARSDFHDVLNWKKNYHKITFKRMGKVGDEDVYVIDTVFRKPAATATSSQR